MMSVSRIGGKNLLLTDRTNAWRESSALIMPRKNYSTTEKKSTLKGDIYGRVLF